MQEQLTQLANILAMSENDEKDSYIKGLFDGSEIEMNLKIKVKKSVIESVIIGNSVYVGSKYHNPAKK